LELLSQEYDALQNKTASEKDDPLASAPDYQRHANGFAWRALLEEEARKDAEPSDEVSQAVTLWDCPICAQPQMADERFFNEHIDGCLSKQTIRDIVSESSQTKVCSMPPTTHATTINRKRGRPSNDGLRQSSESAKASDKRIKKFFFT